MLDMLIDKCMCIHMCMHICIDIGILDMLIDACIMDAYVDALWHNAGVCRDVCVERCV